MVVWRNFTGLLLAKIGLVFALVSLGLNVPKEDGIKLVHTCPGQSISIYDEEVRKVSGVGVEIVRKKLVNSKEGPSDF
ncbi:hypothetical protein RJ641_032849 [Dillenia turbinata]|uniref:Uncharacterized protein n=1 Tax=Dillenia turbinata TaxID=194707 RepID=A0AAN8ZCT7_9MAGN